MDFVTTYLEWLKSKFEEKELRNEVHRITTPFIDRNNDFVEIYIVKISDGLFRITDDGSTISELEFSGMDIFKSERRKKILTEILNSYGVSINDNHEIYVDVDKSNFAFKKHMLLQCIIKISDLFYISSASIKSLFSEDVKMFFDANDIRYVQNIQIQGKSKFNSNFDFAIPHSKQSPDKLIKLINDPRSDNIKSVIFAWEDTKEERNSLHETKLYAFINDSNKKISTDSINALKQYGIEHINWSEKEDAIPRLVA